MTLKIEAGKYYIDTTGEKIGPMIASGHDSWPWIEKHGDGRCWKNNGETINHNAHDLIKEWINPNLSNPCGTAFGLMDEVYGEGTQQAMKDHGGPYEWYSQGGWVFSSGLHLLSDLVYRVKPTPRMETVELYAPEGKVAEVTKIDGEIDWSTLKEV